MYLFSSSSTFLSRGFTNNLVSWGQDLLDWKTAELFSNAGVLGTNNDQAKRLSLKLYKLAGKCEVGVFFWVSAFV